MHQYSAFCHGHALLPVWLCIKEDSLLRGTANFLAQDQEGLATVQNNWKINGSQRQK